MFKTVTIMILVSVFYADSNTLQGFQNQYSLRDTIPKPRVLVDTTAKPVVAGPSLPVKPDRPGGGIRASIPKKTSRVRSR